jgi:hypothetical protein
MYLYSLQKKGDSQKKKKKINTLPVVPSVILHSQLTTEVNRTARRVKLVLIEFYHAFMCSGANGRALKKLLPLLCTILNNFTQYDVKIGGNFV